jgi:hypothetical protein
MKLVRIIFSTLVAVSLVATQVQAAGGAGGGGGPGGGGGGGGAGGGGGGGVAPPPAPNPLPQTPPEPGIVFRESFGFGIAPAFVRPTGGKGTPRATNAPNGQGAGLSQFWVEYPGSSKSLWSATNWNFEASSVDIFEIPSPLQGSFNGAALSDWRDGIVRTGDLVAPFTPPTTKYSVSAEILPPGLPGSYVGFGITTSAATVSNLPASGELWVRFVADQPLGTNTGTYEILSGSRVLATGRLVFFTFTPVEITVDQAAGTATVSIQGLPVATFAARITSRFLAFEGQGIGEDVIVRTVP